MGQLQREPGLGFWAAVQGCCFMLLQSHPSTRVIHIIQHPFHIILSSLHLKQIEFLLSCHLRCPKSWFMMFMDAPRLPCSLYALHLIASILIQSLSWALVAILFLFPCTSLLWRVSYSWLFLSKFKKDQLVFLGVFLAVSWRQLIHLEALHQEFLFLFHFVCGDLRSSTDLISQEFCKTWIPQTFTDWHIRSRPNRTHGTRTLEWVHFVTCFYQTCYPSNIQLWHMADILPDPALLPWISDLLWT